MEALGGKGGVSHGIQKMTEAENADLNLELFITDPKRRRKNITDIADSVDTEMRDKNIGLSENLYGAGPGLQARQAQ